MRNLKRLSSVCACLLVSVNLFAQDPTLPSANFGFNNMNAGGARNPGLYYAGFLQTFQSTSIRDITGKIIPGAPSRSSITSLQQLTYVSKVKVLNTHLGATVLIPIVKNATSGSLNQSANPNPFGDLMIGAFVEGKNNFNSGKELDYRFGVNVFLPTGSYDSRYSSNPGTHRYRIFPHLECTFVPGEHFAVSVKNNLYFYAREIGSPERSGTTYNLNYAVEYRINKQLTFEAAGYYLKQLGQDSYNGDDHYYQDRFGIIDTREQVFAAGPGLGYKTKSAVTIEMKAIWEASARNHPQGFRTNLSVAFAL